MKSFVARSVAIVLAVACTRALSGQETSGPVLARGHYATISAPATPDLGQGTFPSLAQRADDRALSESNGERGPKTSKLAGPSAITVASSLAVVLGLFAAFVWLTRKFGSRSINGAGVPKEWVQPLGSTPIDSRTRITLVRCGNRILVMAQTAAGVQALTEITDAEEVRELTAACLGDAKPTFASALHSLENEKAGAGFVGTPPQRAAVDDRSTPCARGRLFTSA